MSQRVELARNLLMKTDMPLADVAQACGFADQSHFTRIFSAATGLPRGHGAARPAMQVPQRFAEEGPPMSGRVVKPRIRVLSASAMAARWMSPTRLVRQSVPVSAGSGARVGSATADAQSQ
ncbi:helix-turn-helix domain-containing protein [Tardiphaga robiniae]|uniref:helix-turn-helix domain-containing protein n=1 Tax=Tardiphaga TaxID=1395974 RepID=UPI0023EB2010|nr:helix-turn-helix domain-containing protein [Tardiphaga robiniae]